MSTTTTGSSEPFDPAPAVSVAQMFLDRVTNSPRREALRFPVAARWESLTWEQVARQSFDLAAGLLYLGLRPEERAAIICSTRYEWILADLAIMCSGGATTAIYPSTDASDVAYMLSDSGTRIARAISSGTWTTRSMAESSRWAHALQAWPRFRQQRSGRSRRGSRHSGVMIACR